MVCEGENELGAGPQSSREPFKPYSTECHDHKLCFRKFELEATPGCMGVGGSKRERALDLERCSWRLEKEPREWV